MMAVKFLKASGRYNPGDVAAFEPAKARELIAQGVAEAHKAKAVTA